MIRREYAAARNRPCGPRGPPLFDDIRLLAATAWGRCREAGPTGCSNALIQRFCCLFAGAIRRSELFDLVREGLAVYRHDGL